MFDLLSLAFNRIRNQKKNSVLLFFIYLISLSSAIFTISIYGSIVKTNSEIRKTIYGEWDYLVSECLPADFKWLNDQEGIELVGQMQIGGSVGGCGIGTVDQNMAAIGNLKLDQGTWPADDQEIAMEADLLSFLGYDYEIGQTVTLSYSIFTKQGEIVREKDFVLSGIVHEYTNIWVVSSFGKSYLLPSAVVYSLSALSDPEIPVTAPVINNAVCLTEAYKADALKGNGLKTAIQKHLEDDQHKVGNPESDPQSVIFANFREKLDLSEKYSTEIYVLLIALVAFAGLIAVSVINLPAQMRYTTTIRILGADRGKLCLMGIIETILLLIPSSIISIPLARGLMHVALELINRSQNYPVMVEMPSLEIAKLFILWIFIAAASRLLCTFYCIVFPLNEKTYGRGQRFKKLRWLHEALVLVPMCILGMSFFYGVIEGNFQKGKEDTTKSEPHYIIFNEIIMKENPEDPEEPDLYRPLMKEEELRYLSSVSGIEKSEAVSRMDIEISQNKTEKQSVPLIIINPLMNSPWKEVLDLSEVWDEFTAGNMVILCFPDPSVSEEHLAEQIELYDISTQDWNHELLSGGGDVTLYFTDSTGREVGQIAVASYAKELSSEIDKRISSAELHSKCTVIASSRLISKFTDSFAGDMEWFSVYQKKAEWDFIQSLYDKNTGNGADELLLWTDYWKNTLYTDNTIAAFCKDHALSLTNNRQKLMAQAEAELQKRILIYVLAVCAGLIALFVSVGVCSVEAQSEKVFYKCLRILGLSRMQAGLRIFCRTFIRSASASAAGGFLYLAYRICLQIYEAAHPIEEYYEAEKIGIQLAFTHFSGNCSYYGIGAADFVLAGICSALILLLMLFTAKRKLLSEQIYLSR